jgi:hypothetical protein
MLRAALRLDVPVLESPTQTTLRPPPAFSVAGLVEFRICLKLLGRVI